MSRMQTLVQRPKRTLAALATVLVAVGITTASGANFNAQSANAANTFSTGSLTMDNSLAGAAILTASNLRPGDPATVSTVDIKNTGTLSGVFTLSKGTLSDSDATYPMSAKLDATIVDCGVTLTVTDPICGDAGDSTVYSGTIAGMGTGLALGTFVPSARHRYQFSVALNSSADNNYQSDSSTVQFVWNAS
ncbi:MAG: CalY family protein [Actinomycetota bacterium]|nr:CalY family protein [Actinomycetota bacterium]